MNLKETCDAIKALKIQGAENVTTAALKALENTIEKSKAKTKQALLQELEHANMLLFKTRSTEPEMRNYCNEILCFLQEFPEKNIQHAKHALKENIKHTLKKREERKERLLKIGEIFLVDELKQKELKVYTHCHSSTVTAILKKTNKRKKKSVINTETRPLLQGRRTAQECTEAGIAVSHYVDAAMIEAMKQADIIMIGADAITFEGIYNKIGSELLAHLANHMHKPLYICASLWKYDPHKEKIEQRPEKEIWENPPKGLHIQNPAFEKIHFKHVKRIICEEGVLKPKKFLRKAKKHIQTTTYLYP